MAGVGASYVLFDLLAYYGLKIYLWIHNRDNDEDLEEEIENISVVGSKEAVPVDPSQAKYILTQNVGEKEEPSKEDLSTVAGMPNVELNELVLNSNDLTEAEISEEDIEVMGGGDAVLSAVIAAWLGWQRLFFALVVAFIVGTAIGIGLLAKEMYEAKLLVKAIRPMVLGALAGALIAILIFASFGLVAHLDMDLLPWTPFICLGALGGGLFGFVTVGTRVSKPFPFGPSLACGAVLAIFWDPFGADQSFGA
jgi:prepilin signal peptidase PulO-like enzyme (type II secretory pathway)